MVLSQSGAEYISDSLDGNGAKFRDALSGIEEGGAPKWIEDQPHEFEHGRLETFFKEKYEAHKLADLYRASPWAKRASDEQIASGELDWQFIFHMYERTPMYSKKWYELKIYERFLSQNSATSEKWSFLQITIKHACQLGRRIEHYRWKFSHEFTALRARSSEEKLLKTRENRQKGGDLCRCGIFQQQDESRTRRTCQTRHPFSADGTMCPCVSGNSKRHRVRETRQGTLSFPALRDRHWPIMIFLMGGIKAQSPQPL